MQAEGQKYYEEEVKMAEKTTPGEWKSKAGQIYQSNGQFKKAIEDKATTRQQPVEIRGGGNKETVQNACNNDKSDMKRTLLRLLK